MSSVQGTSRFRAWTERLVVVRGKEDTEEGSGGVSSFPRLREKKADQSQPGSAERHCWYHLMHCGVMLCVIDSIIRCGWMLSNMANHFLRKKLQIVKPIFMTETNTVAIIDN